MQIMLDCITRIFPDRINLLFCQHSLKKKKSLCLICSLQICPEIETSIFKMFVKGIGGIQTLLFAATNAFWHHAYMPFISPCERHSQALRVAEPNAVKAS